MKIDANTVVQKLVNQIADLQLQVAILQAKIEELENQLEQKQGNKDKQAQ